MSAASDSSWIRLPFFDAPVYLLGPTPAQATVAVEPFTPLGEARTAVQTFVAGWCDARGNLLEPLELDLLVEPNRIVPRRQVPLQAALEARPTAAAIQLDLSPLPGFDWLQGLQRGAEPVGPLLFCRKTRTLFAARGRSGNAPLGPLPGEQDCSGEVFPALVSCEREGEQVTRCYSGATGEVDGQSVASLEQLLVDQAHVANAAADRADWVCQCEDCRQVDDDAAEYKAALDRLVVVHAAPAPLVIRPHGEWTLPEAMAIVGRRPLREMLHGLDNAYQAWRTERGEQFLRSGPSHLLEQESDGRNLTEILRIKLGLVGQVLEQLEQVWQATERPHLSWDADTIRVAWRGKGAVPGNAWGLGAILGRIGFQPTSELDTVQDNPLPFPPVFSNESLLPQSVADTSRQWDEPRPVNLFVKTAEDGDGGQKVTVLLEEMGLPWEPFALEDTLHVKGDGWDAVLSPCKERDPNDGEGLPFHGVVRGKKLKVGEDYPGGEARWYPRYGEAVDLFALAMLALDGLLGTDERSGGDYHEAIHAACNELQQSLLALPIEQREAAAHNFVAERAEMDAPAAVWTRRNLLYRREDRGQTRLEGMPGMLWQATVLWLLRMLTHVPGFSYCPDRTARAPRSGELLLPLLELRGLLALLDDALWQRQQPAEQVHATLTAEDDE